MGLFSSDFWSFFSKHANSHSLQNESHHPTKTPCRVEQHPFFTLKTLPLTDIERKETESHFCKCFISVCACCFPFPQMHIKFWLHSRMLSLKQQKKRVKVISSIGMWPYRPSLTKILSPTLMSSTVNNPSARAYSLVTWVERRVKQQACNSPAAKEKKGWTLLYIGAVFTSLIIYYQMCAAARFHLELITNESETYEKNVTFY